MLKMNSKLRSLINIQDPWPLPNFSFHHIREPQLFVFFETKTFEQEDLTTWVAVGTFFEMYGSDILLSELVDD